MSIEANVTNVTPNSEQPVSGSNEVQENQELMGDEELNESSDASTNLETSQMKIDQAADEGKITAAEAKELKKKLKLKVDGQEFEEEIDFNDEESLKRHLQKSKAFDRRLKEFSTYKNQVDAALEMLQKDPETFLEKMGLNVDEFAEKRLSRKIEEMKKSPEQIAREKMEKELSDLREEKKRIEEDRQKIEIENLRNQAAQEIENDITSALDDVKSILPKKNPLVLQRIAQTMLLAMQNGYSEVTAKDVIPLVEKQWKQELNEFFSVIPEEALEMLVGKPNLDKYRKKKISSRPKVNTSTARQIAQDVGVIRQEEQPKEKRNFKDFFKLNE